MSSGNIANVHKAKAHVWTTRARSKHLNEFEGLGRSMDGNARSHDKTWVAGHQIETAGIGIVLDEFPGGTLRQGLAKCVWVVVLGSR